MSDTDPQDSVTRTLVGTGADPNEDYGSRPWRLTPGPGLPDPRHRVGDFPPAPTREYLEPPYPPRPYVRPSPESYPPAFTVCPVCSGRGSHPLGFYEGDLTITTSASGRERCRTCDGQGTIPLLGPGKPAYPPTRQKRVIIHHPSQELAT